MFDIGSVELFVVVVVTLVIVGPRELPTLVRGVGKIMGTVRGLTSEFKSAVSDLANEVEREQDPYRSLRAKEGVHQGMSPEEVTNTIMANRAREAAEEADIVSGAEPSEERVSKADTSPDETDAGTKDG